MSAQDRALDTARAGHAVFPCNPDDKSPRTTNGFHDASSDVDVVAAMNWTEPVLIGLRPPPDVVVIDPDPRNGGDKTVALLESVGRVLPATRTVRTPRGGTHHYYRLPDEIVGQKLRSSLGPGVDVKYHANGYVCDPESTGYELVDGREITDAPSWLLDELVVPEGDGVEGEAHPPKYFPFQEGTAYGLSAREGEIAKLRAAVERNNTLNATCFALGQLHAGGELDEESTLGLIREVADEIGLYEPGEARKTDGTIKSGWKSGMKKPRQAPPKNDEVRKLPPPEDLAGVLDEVEAIFLRYTFLPEFAYVVLPLWAAHTHVFERFPTTPRLHFSSPERECGKSRSLEVLQALCHNAKKTTSMTGAVLFRGIDAWRPTLLLDEIDNLLGKEREKSERVGDILAVLNDGYRKGATVPRCVGDKHEPHEFNAFCPIALAGIRDIPDTIASRSIRVPLQRAKPGEVEPFEIGHDDAIIGELGLRLASSVQALDTPTDRSWREGLGDREADCWAPLFAIAAAAGGAWLERAQVVAHDLHARKADDVPVHDTGSLLLRDVVALFRESKDDTMTPDTLRVRLLDLDESPWHDYAVKGGFSTKRIAQLLRPYDVRAIKSNSVRAYRRESVEAAGERFA